MEEHVGKLWHRLITHLAATQSHPTVTLTEVKKTVGILFRALGGDGGLLIEATNPTAHQARRSWLQRLAGSQTQVELGWRDEETLRLPSQINLFPQKDLNRELYLWLAALAAGEIDHTQPWFIRNQNLTHQTLQHLPGLQTRYQRLVEAYLTLRPVPETRAEQAQEAAIRQALRAPGSVLTWPAAKLAPYPVHLWMHPSPPRKTVSASHVPDPPTHPPRRSENLADKRRRRAERVESPDGKTGLLAFRLESLFTLAEYVKVDRCTDDEEDPQAAKQALEDLELVSVSRDNRITTAATLRFDLDLAASQSDDAPVRGDILLPEWDYQRQQLRPAYCCLQPVFYTANAPCELPPHLRQLARKLRRQFESLLPLRMWYKAQPDGNEIDLDAYLSHVTECRFRGHASAEEGLYRDFRGGQRDLACLLLADFSMSTDAWVNNQARVIDIIRDSLFLFAEALETTGDRFAIYGFCSHRRQQVQFHILKAFEQPYNATIRGHLNAIKPGFYTRMGAAIRQATSLLVQQKASQRLLLLLTDGKPNDLDIYEGRYGVEDTRVALREAHQQGLQTFCVTIDEKAEDYLPHIFGSKGYIVIRKPAQLPKELPLLYARLTRS